MVDKRKTDPLLDNSQVSAQTELMKAGPPPLGCLYDFVRLRSNDRQVTTCSHACNPGLATMRLQPYGPPDEACAQTDLQEDFPCRMCVGRPAVELNRTPNDDLCNWMGTNTYRRFGSQYTVIA